MHRIVSYQSASENTLDGVLMFTKGKGTVLHVGLLDLPEFIYLGEILGGVSTEKQTI